MAIQRDKLWLMTTNQLVEKLIPEHQSPCQWGKKEVWHDTVAGRNISILKARRCFYFSSTNGPANSDDYHVPPYEPLSTNTNPSWALPVTILQNDPLSLPRRRTPIPCNCFLYYKKMVQKPFRASSLWTTPFAWPQNHSYFSISAHLFPCQNSSTALLLVAYLHITPPPPPQNPNYWNTVPCNWLKDFCDASLHTLVFNRYIH